MSLNQLEKLAWEFTRMARNDIREKFMSLMKEVEANEKELANALKICDTELRKILELDGDISLSTFAKILIATGNTLEIKPIEDANIGGCGEEVVFPFPHPNVFERQKPHPMPSPFCTQTFSRPTTNDVYTTEEKFDEQRHNHCEQPRDALGRFVAKNRLEMEKPKREVSPFERLPIDRLKKIIRERLWDSEIDINNSSKGELVAFLDEKNKRMIQHKQTQELEEDPNVKRFKEKLKETFVSNPHLFEWVQKYLGELAN